MLSHLKILEGLREDGINVTNLVFLNTRTSVAPMRHLVLVKILEELCHLCYDALRTERRTDGQTFYFIILD